MSSCYRARRRRKLLCILISCWACIYLLRRISIIYIYRNGILRALPYASRARQPSPLDRRRYPFSAPPASATIRLAPVGDRPGNGRTRCPTISRPVVGRIAIRNGQNCGASGCATGGRDFDHFWPDSDRNPTSSPPAPSP